MLNAVRGGGDIITRILLDAGADPNWCSPHDTVLIEAAQKRNVGLAKLLVDYGADVNFGSPSPIVIAVVKEHVDMLRLFREHGARLDTPESGGWAMAAAKSHGLCSMVELLVSEGVDEDSVLHRARERDEIDWWYKLDPNRASDIWD